MLSQFLKSPEGRALLGRLIGWYGGFCAATTRWTVIGGEAARTAWAGGPVIVCFWHNRLLQVHAAWPRKQAGRPLRVLISNSRDGDTITEAARTVGLDAVRGSSAQSGKDKGAMAAVRDMISHLRAGGALGVTPDGPRGPRMRAELGAVQVAKVTGAPILCFAWSQRGRRVLEKSWDKHLVPVPFGRGTIVWSEPMRVTRDADIEAARATLEDTLTRVSDEADRAAGAEPIPAAPVARVTESATP